MPKETAGRRPAGPTAKTLLAEAKRRVLADPAEAEKIAKAVSAIVRAQCDHADWLDRTPARRGARAAKEIDIDERRAAIIRTHAADIARARDEGFEAGRAAGSDRGGLLGPQRAAGSEAAGE